MAQHLGEMYTIGDGVDRSGAEALRWFMLAADQGLPKAYHCIAPVPRSWLWCPLQQDRGHSPVPSRRWQESLSHAGALH